MKASRISSVLFVATSMAAWCTPAHSQDRGGASPLPRATEPAEITVVATRREQKLQDVPLAVTAVGQDALRLNQVKNVADIGSLTPNMISIAGTAGGAKSAPQFSIRGQSQQERGGLADPSVGVYFGDVAIVRTQGLNQSLFDVRAVEVIRGPVGTLFGKNATGGAIIIRPNVPTTSQVEGSAGVTIAEFGTINADAYVNVPLSDAAAIRVGGSTANDNGYTYDKTLRRNINNTHNMSLRGSLLLELGSIENIAMVNYFKEDDGGSGGFARYLNPNGTIATAAAVRGYRPVSALVAEQATRGPRQINNGTPEFNIVDTIDVHNTTSIDLGSDTKIKNIFGWRRVNSHILVDLDGTEHPLLHTEIYDKSDQVSDELQLVGKAGGLDWIVGGYFFKETGDNNASSIIAGAENNGVESPTTFVNGGTNNRQKFRNLSYAVFAEGTYPLVDGLSLTLGGRYTWDERNATILNRVINTRCGFTVDADNNPATPEVNPGDGPNCRIDASAKFDAFTYNVALNFKPDTDTLIYASLRRGFRAGGFSARATTEVGLRRPFKPEFVRNIELGFKRDWHFGGAFLQTNIALFHSDYTNVQRQAVDTTGTSPFTVVINADKATIKGIEFEALFRPVERFTLSGFWGYTEAKFDKFINPFTNADLSSQTFARVPKNNWRISGTVDLVKDERVGNISFTATYTGRDSFLDTDNTTIPYGVIPAHEQLNLFLRAQRLAGTNLDATVFVRNVANKQELQPLASVYSSLGFAAVVPGAPRQVGVQLRYDF